MFYYKDGYAEEASDAIKNLVLARDSYIKAVCEWRNIECKSFDDELEELKCIFDLIFREEMEEFIAEKAMNNSIEEAKKQQKEIEEIINAQQEPNKR